jgi:hypothetical protein
MTIAGRKRALVIVPAVAAVAVGGALLATRPWGGEGASGAPAEYRVCNLVYQPPPESSPFEVSPVAVDLFNDGKPLLMIGLTRVTTDPVTGEEKNESAGANIDAETGAVLDRRTFTREDDAAIDEVLANLRFEPFDPAAAPWPYNDVTTVPARRLTAGNGDGSFRLPDPASGMTYTHISGGDGSERIRLSTCKSQAIIDLGSGEIVWEKAIHSDDAAAFEAFRAAVGGS